jgi:hypothetical protein
MKRRRHTIGKRELLVRFNNFCRHGQKAILGRYVTSVGLDGPTEDIVTFIGLKEYRQKLKYLLWAHSQSTEVTGLNPIERVVPPSPTVSTSDLVFLLPHSAHRSLCPIPNPPPPDVGAPSPDRQRPTPLCPSAVRTLVITP